MMSKDDIRPAVLAAALAETIITSAENAVPLAQKLDDTCIGATFADIIWALTMVAVRHLVESATDAEVRADLGAALTPGLIAQVMSLLAGTSAMIELKDPRELENLPESVFRR